MSPELVLSLQFMDTDSILTNNQTLKFLMAQNKSVVAPMLDSQTFYSNFWCGITPQVSPQKALESETAPWWRSSLPWRHCGGVVPQGFYRRTADYFPTKNRQRRGCFRVPMVYATFLIDLRKEETSHLAFYPPHPNYTWAFDDIIVFAYSCQEAGEGDGGFRECRGWGGCAAHLSHPAGVEVHVCNQHHFGYINVPVKAHQTLEDDHANFVHLTLEAMGECPWVERSWRPPGPDRAVSPSSQPGESGLH